jgi:hypothetical protein
LSGPGANLVIRPSTTEIKMNAVQIREITHLCVKAHRKGEIESVTTTPQGLEVKEMFFMPHANEIPAGLVRLDVEFFIAAIDKVEAEKHKADLKVMIEEGMGAERLSKEIGYIDWGGLIGDQETALMFMALGDVMGFWMLLTPSRMGMPADMCRTMAGAGMITTSPYRWEGLTPHDKAMLDNLDAKVAAARKTL